MSSGSEVDNRGQANESIVFRSTLDGQDETKLSTRVLMALESIPDYDVESGETAVFDYVDLEALDKLFDPATGKPRSGRVTFPLDQYEVAVTAAGKITIRRGRIALE